MELAGTSISPILILYAKLLYKWLSFKFAKRVRVRPKMTPLTGVVLLIMNLAGFISHAITAPIIRAKSGFPLTLKLKINNNKKKVGKKR